jgi:hypothetical protein
VLVRAENPRTRQAPAGVGAGADAAAAEPMGA